jgi:hypothetical protein
MPIRSYKPTSPGRRFQTRSTFEEITTDKPHKPLVESTKRGSGRNQQGRLTVRHRGGGAKRNYRRIDFRRDKFDVPARLATIEYDPNRSARIGLLHYADGEKRYILVPQGLQVGTRSSPETGRGTRRQRPSLRAIPWARSYNMRAHPRCDGDHRWPGAAAVARRCLRARACLRQVRRVVALQPRSGGHR